MKVVGGIYMGKLKEDIAEDLARTIHKMSSAEQENLLKLLEQLERQMNEEKTRHRAHHALDRAIRAFGDRAVDSNTGALRGE
jgi:hypothetical protein